MLYTKNLPPSFQRSTLESSSSSALFVTLLYQKQNELQICTNPRFSIRLKLPVTSYHTHPTKIVASFLRNRRLHPIYYCKSFEFVIIASINPYSNAS